MVNSNMKYDYFNAFVYIDNMSRLRVGYWWTKYFRTHGHKEKKKTSPIQYLLITSWLTDALMVFLAIYQGNIFLLDIKEWRKKKIQYMSGVYTAKSNRHVVREAVKKVLRPLPPKLSGHIFWGIFFLKLKKLFFLSCQAGPVKKRTLCFFRLP